MCHVTNERRGRVFDGQTGSIKADIIKFIYMVIYWCEREIEREYTLYKSVCYYS